MLEPRDETNSKRPTNTCSKDHFAVYMDVVPVSFHVHLSSSVSTTKYPSDTPGDDPRNLTRNWVGSPRPLRQPSVGSTVQSLGFVSAVNAARKSENPIKGF